jgi:Molybdopterin converting factor, small subunit
MRVTLKLYATLTGYLPQGAEKHAVKIDVPVDTTVYKIIDQFNVPRAMAHLVLLNGIYLHPDERDKQKRLKDGDTLAVWPPVAGG